MRGVSIEAKADDFEPWAFELSSTLTDDEAWEFAQFLKRVTHSDYLSNAEGNEEANLMMRAGEKIRKALSDAGYEPR